MQDTLEDQHWILNHQSQGYITLADLSGLNTALHLLLASDPHISGLKNENVELSKIQDISNKLYRDAQYISTKLVVSWYYSFIFKHIGPYINI